MPDIPAIPSGPPVGRTNPGGAAPLTATAIVCRVGPLARRAIRSAFPAIAWAFLKPLIGRIIKIVVDLVIADMIDRATSRAIAADPSDPTGRSTLVVMGCEVLIDASYAPDPEATTARLAAAEDAAGVPAGPATQSD